MFVCSLLLNGALTQIICLFLVLVCGRLFGCRFKYERSGGCPLFFRAFWYSSLVSSNIRSLDELSDNRLPMDFGIWSMTAGGWFEGVFTYRSLSFSFVNG